MRQTVQFTLAAALIGLAAAACGEDTAPTSGQAEVLAADWKHPYSREEAAYPLAGDHRGKYWPPVRRIDQAYGDRNLMCSCPPVAAFQD